MKGDLSYGKDHTFIPAFSVKSGNTISVLDDIWCYTNQIVNVIFIGTPETGFVMVDAGMPYSSGSLLKAAASIFGEGRKPEAIILTHGHFDHTGSIIELIKHWNIPVYAHEREIPYLNGEENYPEPDSSVEGGMIAKISPFFPHKGVNIREHVRALPENGSVPYLPEFRWVHTPGHTPGHISLFRDRDQTLIAGDAFVTVKQDELYQVFTQKIEMNGPPRYLTTDWEAAANSVKKLAELHPKTAITGHGRPVEGRVLEEGLPSLMQTFPSSAVPDYGKFVQE
ncbi:MBL fold metallo-hydrolase [Salibacterium halotolerans]|uniref:Glyoxylase, beta-lactamase superfamily II n=1 Tax=Salibacterium halotolerans TaxID=1884432 RepID=A0A1I5QIU7_9BACI|nr:MBL fold metallo-hydrolase [Salibacterium halotolerans]SFP45806.1 Glyoxylase, beta-lactamase superfamily II [Salibacterium halotolerans]